jgi:hypothetical protein
MKTRKSIHRIVTVLCLVFTVLLGKPSMALAGQPAPFSKKEAIVLSVKQNEARSLHAVSCGRGGTSTKVVVWTLVAVVLALGVGSLAYSLAEADSVN